MLNNILDAFEYLGDGLLELPPYILAVALLGVLVLVLEWTRARKYTVLQRKLPGGLMLDGRTLLRGHLASHNGESVDLGTSHERGQKPSAYPELAAKPFVFVADDGRQIQIAPGAPLKIEVGVTNASRQLLDTVTAQGGVVQQYNFVLDPRTPLWLIARLPAQSMFGPSPHREGGPLFVPVTPGERFELYGAAPPNFSEGFGCGCFAVPLGLFPVLYAAGVRDWSTGLMVFAGIVSAALIWRVVRNVKLIAGMKLPPGVS